MTIKIFQDRGICPGLLHPKTHRIFYNVSLRTGDRCHRCGNPHPLPPKKLFTLHFSLLAQIVPPHFILQSHPKCGIIEPGRDVSAMLLKRIYCRVFQACFGLGARVLPWRKPECITGAGSLESLPGLLQGAGCKKPAPMRRAGVHCYGGKAAGLERVPPGDGQSEN